MNNDNIQNIQEKEYEIPYHYLITADRLIAFPEKLIACPHYIYYLTTIQNLLTPFTGQEILDIGCGDGRFCHDMRNENVQISGIDYSQQAIGFASVLNPAIDFYVADITHGLPFENESFDKVVCIETLEHIAPDAVAYTIPEIHRILKANGILVITVPHHNRKLDKKHYQHFSTADLSILLKDYFLIDKFVGFHRKSSVPNMVYTGITLLYYYLYPLRSVGFEKILNKIREKGYKFFSTYLKECAPDDGFSLICRAVKKNG